MSFKSLESPFTLSRGPLGDTGPESSIKVRVLKSRPAMIVPPMPREKIPDAAFDEMMAKLEKGLNEAFSDPDAKLIVIDSIPSDPKP